MVFGFTGLSVATLTYFDSRKQCDFLYSSNIVRDNIHSHLAELYLVSGDQRKQSEIKYLVVNV